MVGTAVQESKNGRKLPRQQGMLLYEGLREWTFARVLLCECLLVREARESELLQEVAELRGALATARIAQAAAEASVMELRGRSSQSRGEGGEIL